jgi:hypothetical protein
MLKHMSPKPCEDSIPMGIPISPKSRHQILPIGAKFGRLTIASQPYKLNTKRHDIFYDCDCDCGITKRIRYQYLSNSDAISCGCRMRETQIENGAKNMLKHGFKRRKSKHPLYQTWYGINKRCYNQKIHSFKRYGGRGIIVCEEWRHNPEVFIQWGIDNGWKAGLEIDRKDNDGPYSPQNCRFVTKKQNCRNQRSNRLITIDNETKTMVEWCEIYNRYYRTVNARINTLGVDPVKAVLTPTKRGFCGTSHS